MRCRAPALAYAEIATAGIWLIPGFSPFFPHQLQHWPSAHGAVDPVHPMLLCEPQILSWQAAALALTSLHTAPSTGAHAGRLPQGNYWLLPFINYLRVVPWTCPYWTVSLYFPAIPSSYQNALGSKKEKKPSMYCPNPHLIHPIALTTYLWHHPRKWVLYKFWFYTSTISFWPLFCNLLIRTCERLSNASSYWFFLTCQWVAILEKKKDWFNTLFLTNS